LFVSRFPRTAALILAGSAMSVAGQIMQMLTLSSSDSLPI